MYTKHATRRAGRVALDREYMCVSVRVPVELLSINRTRTST